MNKKVLTGAAALFAAAGIVGSGTFASFHDEEVVPVQSFSAGTLNLQMDGTAVSTPINLTNMKPGDQSESWYEDGDNQPSIPAGLQDELVRVENTGTLPGTLHVYMVKDSDAENSLVDPEVDLGDTAANGGELDANMLILFDGISQVQAGGPLLGEWLASANVGDKQEIGMPASVLQPGAANERYFRIAYKVPSTAGNEIQSDSTSFHFEFSLQQ
jgi:predicted ribosomally synthesized peptide with SipW-like signal peptide